MFLGSSMSIDINWNSIGANKQEAITDPRDIYSSLNGRQFPRLRPEQNEVLECWYQRREETDLVIKQNTGSGKTLTGLLIAQSGLNEKIGPSIYLVPDKFLACQVVSEARLASIPVTQEERNQDFLASKAILVTNFYKLLNGRSVLARKALGTVIIDDAHAALANSDNLFSVSIPRECKAFTQLLKLFENQLKQQSAKAYSEICEGEFSSPIRVPTRAVIKHADEILDIMQPFAKDDQLPSIFFTWPYVADHLKLSVITVSTQSIEIKTPCPDINRIFSFAQAKRKIYLTATLEDEGELVTELNANPETVKKVIVPKRASDLGDRLIIAPLAIDTRMDASAIHKLARAFANGDRDLDGKKESETINVVVLVPSDKKAKEWQGQADYILHVQDMGPVIQEMKTRNDIGVVVLVNKYDGVDLPDEACRLLIIDGVPIARTPSEQREESALTRSPSLKAKIVQKIEQGMGRGTRTVTDYCAVLLLGSTEALTIKDEQQLQFYSPATKAQIQLSSQLAEQMKGGGLEAITQLLSIFLQRDNRWVSRSLANTATVEYNSDARISDLEIARRRAFNAAIINDFPSAVSILEKALNDVKDDAERGWYKEELSGYLEFVDHNQARSCLEEAKRCNPEVMMPDQKPMYHRLSAPKLQGQQVIDNLQSLKEPKLSELDVEDLFRNIAWGIEETANKAEESVKILGNLLGFDASRPEKEQGDGGPDVLWAMSTEQYAVIELKTEITRDDKTISKSEAEQLTHSAEAWFPEKYPGCSAIPVFLHPYTTLDPRAHVPAGTRVITQADLQHLEEDVMNFIRTLISKYLLPNSRNIDIDIVGQELSTNHLTADRIIKYHSQVAGKVTTNPAAKR